MRKLGLAAALFIASTSLAAAESANGNWGCKTPDGVNGGVLTVQAPSFGFASPVPGSGLSGLGSVTAYQDGITFDQGPLHDALGVRIGRLTMQQGTLGLRLETDNAVALSCTRL